MKKLITISLIAILLSACNPTSYDVRYYNNCKVNDKGIVKKENENQHRIYSTCGTFVIEDSFYLMRFDSADIYGSIDQHKSYDFKVGGIRNGFLSMFPNIIDVKESK